MNRRFVHIGINPIGALARQNPQAPWPPNFHQTLQSYLGKISTDWFRYGSQNYVIWTNADLANLSSEIAALPGFQHVYVLATEINTFSGYNGWMPEEFWTWLKQYRI